MTPTSQGLTAGPSSLSLRQPVALPPIFWPTLIILAAFAVRMVQLDVPALRWDEGWSIAQASLPWRSLFEIASEEWHPPGYMVLLKVWRLAGAGPFAVRYLSVVIGTLAAPLAYQVGILWTRRRRVGLFAALLAAISPLLIYYGQVARMYALAAFLVLAAAYFLLRGEQHPSGAVSAGLVLTTLAAMLTLYHAVWPLAGLYLAGAIRRPDRVPSLVLAGTTALALYVPWLVFAGSTIRMRLGSGGTGGGEPIAGTLDYLKPTLDGLAFVYGARWPALAVVGAVAALGLLVRPPTWRDAREWLLPLAVVGISVLGVAYSAQSTYWLAARHLVPAGIFLALAVAWSLDALATRWKPLAILVFAALAILYWPTSSQFVYAKTLEVVDPFDPAADHRYLSTHAAPTDLVYFNALAKAGWYESQRRAGDPSWSYALRWVPVVEPMPRLAERIRRDAATHDRLWFVLYKGTYDTNAPLKTWLDATYYPAGGDWQEDTLLLAYVVPGAGWTETIRDDVFGSVIRLRQARLSANVAPNGTLALDLNWEALGPVSTDYKVFVHVTDDSGAVVAQHDAVPGEGRRPTTSWQPGLPMQDRHGVFLPAQLPGRLHVQVGLYDPVTGLRLRLPDGSDQIEIATLEVPPAIGG